MQPIVVQAMLKWPQVPAVYGWLRLSLRGDWFLIDRNDPAFQHDEHVQRGTRIEHAGFLSFIAQNFECDSIGRWFFQNGPQRVFVELDGMPWVLRLHQAAEHEPHTQSFGLRLGHPKTPTWWRLMTHTGQTINTIRGTWITDDGHVAIQTELGLGHIAPQDLFDFEQCLIQPDEHPDHPHTHLLSLCGFKTSSVGTHSQLELFSATLLPAESLHALAQENGITQSPLAASLPANQSSSTPGA